MGRALGVRVGAHSVTHPRLAQLDDVAIADEIGRSVEAVRRAVGVAFAYPDGAYDKRVVEAVQQAGVSSAVTCEEKSVLAGEAELLRLPRRLVASPSMPR